MDAILSYAGSLLEEREPLIAMACLTPEAYLRGLNP
jgi:hypothetical protein